MKKIVGQVSVFCLLSLLAGSGAVSAQSTDATLSGLTVSDASLSPTFASGTVNYTASVGHWVRQVTIAPTANDGGASVAHSTTDANANRAVGRQSLAAASVGIPAALLDQVETPLPAGALEIPAPGSLHSGMGMVSGWACDAEEVSIEIDGQAYPAAYGLERPDTAGACGETGTGFGLVVNWSQWGDGAHEMVAVADGIPASTDPDGVRSGALALNAASAVDNPQYYDDRSLDRANDDAVDYYSFTTDARYQLGLGIRGQSINLDVYLEDADGNVLIQSWPPPGNPSLEWIKTMLDAGTYYVRVVAMESGYTDYYVRFGLTSDPDGVRSGALALNAASAVDNPQYYHNKSLDRANDDAVDYYSFTIDASYYLGLGIRGQSINLDVYLEDANGKLLEPSFPPLGSPSDEWIRRRLAAGTYYVRVVAMENGYTDYYVRFGLTPTAPDHTPDGAVQLNAASAVDNPQYYYHNKSLNLSHGDAVDYYSFTIDASYELGLGIRGQSINLDVYLEDADGNVIIQSWPPPGSPSDEWIRTTLDAGTYYVRVVAMENGYTRYYVRFGLTFPASTDLDSVRSGALALDTASAVDSTQYYPGTINRSDGDAVDYYSFTTNDRYLISLAVERQISNLDMYLEDADGNVITRSSPWGPNLELINEVLDAGTYYIRVVAMTEEFTAYSLSFDVLAP